MSGLPLSWVETDLDDVCSLIRGITFPSSAKESNHTPSNVCCLRTSNIQREVEWHDIYFVSQEYVKRDDQFVQSGDILMSMANSYELVGKVAVAKDVPYTTAFGAFLAAIRPREGVHSQYLFHLLRTAQVQSELRSGSNQTVNIANISVKALSSIQIPLAPLHEQQRIADKLDVLLTKVDACRARLDRVPQVLKRFRQAVLAAATSGQLTEDWREKNSGCVGANCVRPGATSKNGADGNKGACNAPLQDRGEGEELPEGWQWTTVGKYCVESFYGPRFSKEDYTPDGIPTIRTTDFTDNGSISLNNPPRITLPEDKKEKFLLRKNDLLVTRTGSIGKMAIFRESYEALPSAYLIRFRFSEEISVDYVFLSLMSPRGQELLGLGSTAITQPNINAETIKGLPLTLPPLTEQQEIVRRIETLFAFADRLEARYNTARKHVDQLTPSLLAKAFRGELVPKDPNDEPAAVLLERVRAERAKPSSAPAKRRKILQK